MFYFLILVVVTLACLLFKYSLNCILIPRILCMCVILLLKLRERERERMHKQEPLTKVGHHKMMTKKIL